MEHKTEVIEAIRELNKACYAGGKLRILGEAFFLLSDGEGWSIYFRDQLLTWSDKTIPGVTIKEQIIKAFDGYRDDINEYSERINFPIRLPNE